MKMKGFFIIFVKRMFMGAIVIKSENARNLKLLAALAEQLGESVSKLSFSQIEDMQLGMLMKKEKTGTPVSRKAIFKHLNS
jgi:hypothetical protein